MVKIQIKF